MKKRLVVTALASLFLGVMTTGIGVSVSPSLLRVTGPVLCASGTTFVVSEGATVDMPENRRGAPMHFACVAPDGASTDPNLGAAAFVVFVVVTAAWAVVVARGVAKLEAAARGTAHRSGG